MLKSEMLKLATWNVNGIRARQAQVQEWIAQERPDVVCLQELKATSDQVPTALCEMEGYWCHWHGARAYSGVALHVSKTLAPERPTFAHPAFDFETRIATVDVATTAGPLTVASVYVPNGGKDFRATMEVLEAMDALAETYRADPEPRPGRRRPRARSRQRRPVHVVGALAQHAAAQHWLAAGPCVRQRRARGGRHGVPGESRDRDQRPCPGRGKLRVDIAGW